LQLTTNLLQDSTVVNQQRAQAENLVIGETPGI